MPQPVAADRPAARADLLMLAVAVAAVSTSAPLIRVAAAPALAIAMWRNVLAVPVVALIARGRPRPERRERRLIVVSGLLLGLHFALWIPSISYTSVSSSVALVATQPVWAALIARMRGESVEPGVWVGIAVALSGVVLLTGVDFQLSGRALFGDALAVAGGLCAAAYVSVGADARRTLDNAVYTTGCYAVAGASLAALCIIARRDLVGFELETWLAIVGLVVGAQLLGHTLLNQVLRDLSATTVSVAILFEVIGAAAIAAIAFEETPPLAAAPAGLLILSGTAVVIRTGRRRPTEGAPVV